MRFSLYEFEEITGLNCAYREKLEKPEVEITDEIKEFWELLEISVTGGPSYADLLVACERCGDWEREDRIKLGYLALYTTFIEAQAKLNPTRAALAMTVIDPEKSPLYPWGRVAHQFLMSSVKEAEVAQGSYTINGFLQVLHVWVLWALPAYGKKFGEPLPNKPTPPLLAFKGSRGRKNVSKNMHCQTTVKHFVRKELEDMFPVWDNDHDDEKIVNIVKAMFGQFGGKWRWNESHWPPNGVLVSKTKGVKEEDEDEEEDQEEDGKQAVKGGKRKATGGLPGRGKRAKKDGDGDDVSWSTADELVLEVNKGFTDLGDVVKQCFINFGVKLDAVKDSVEVLAADLAVVKNLVNVGVSGEASDVKDKKKKKKTRTKERVGELQGKEPEPKGESKDKEQEKKGESDEKQHEEEEEDEKEEEVETKKQDDDQEREEKDDAYQEGVVEVSHDNQLSLIPSSTTDIIRPLKRSSRIKKRKENNQKGN